MFTSSTEGRLIVLDIPLINLLQSMPNFLVAAVITSPPVVLPLYSFLETVRAQFPALVAAGRIATSTCSALHAHTVLLSSPSNYRWSLNKKKIVMD